uniref:Uncharacterized protein n=1 Tax=Oryza barthii TaxID=65489 RepID=A0A0D3H4E9_9ORYZ
MEVARQSWAGREVDGARGSTNGGRWRGEKTQQRGGLIEPDGSTHEKRNGALSKDGLLKKGETQEWPR